MPLVVIDGIDGTGKKIQTEILRRNLTKLGIAPKVLDFPRYGEGSSVLVKQYLAGDFGPARSPTSLRSVSSFYALDRVCSYLDDWRPDYLAGRWLISNRYVTSNAIHQGAKLQAADRLAYWDWLTDFEYGNLGLPIPEIVFLLDMPFSISDELRHHRGRSDIHENDRSHLMAARETALVAADNFGWQVIDCAVDGRLRSPESIGTEIMLGLSALLPSHISLTAPVLPDNNERW